MSGRHIRRLANGAAPLNLTLRPLVLALHSATAGALLFAAAWSPGVQAQVTAERLRGYDIPAGELAVALNRFAEAAGVFLSAPAELTQGRSPALKGDFTVIGGFAALLAGSGLEAFRQPNGSYGLRASAGAPTPSPTTLPVVQVTASPEAATNELPKPYAGGQIASGAGLGLLGDRGVMEAPFNVTSFTSTLIRNQQAGSVAEVLANDPSISNLKAIGNDYDGFNIRGFLVNNPDIAFAGLYGIAPAQRTFVQGLERIEVIKGPNALLTGINPGGSVGGSINLVPKRAHDEPLTEVTATATSGTVLGTSVDIGRRFGADHQFGVRFNGLFDSGHTDLAYQRERVTNMLLALDFRSNRLRAFLDAGVQNYDVVAPKQHVQLDSGLGIPTPPSANANYTQRWGRVKTTETYGVGRIEYDIDKDTTAYAAVGGKHFDQDSNANIRYRFTDGNGGLSVTPRTGRGLYVEKNASGEVGVRGSIQTWGIRNRWSVGASIFHSSTYYGTTAYAGVPVPEASIYAPVSVADPGTALPDAPRTNRLQNTSLAISDTVSFMGDRLQFTVGGRLQTVGNAAYDPTTGSRMSNYRKSAFTPALGLLFRARDDLSIYANYIQGLSPGEIADPSFANGGQILPPYRTRQYETGVKYDMGALLATVSAFQIEQASSAVDVATNTFQHNGQQRNRGLEFNLFGEPIRGIRFNGGAMLLDPRLTRTDGGADEGNDAPGQPRFKAILRGEWDVSALQGLTVLGYVSYSGGQYVDNGNTQKLPSWTVYGIGARYVTRFMDRPLTIRAKIDNLFAKAYWQSAAFGFLNPGGPRTAVLSATMAF